LEGATEKDRHLEGRVEELGRLINKTAEALGHFLNRTKPAA
jgi:hypothetical protein